VALEQAVKGLLAARELLALLVLAVAVRQKLGKTLARLYAVMAGLVWPLLLLELL
jgi:hypothetical protein